MLLSAWRRRIVAGAALAVLAIALADLAHFSQGWVQFGYRFSNDFAPFAVILVALGIAGRVRRRATGILAAAARRGVGAGQRLGRLVGRDAGMVTAVRGRCGPVCRRGSSSCCRRPGGLRLRRLWSSTCAR